MKVINYVMEVMKEDMIWAMIEGKYLGVTFEETEDDFEVDINLNKDDIVITFGVFESS